MRKPSPRRFYVPSNFDPDKYLPSRYHAYLDEVYYIFHLIHIRKAMNKWSDKEFVPLKADYLREVVPNYRELMLTLIENEVLDIPQQYIQGVRSTGYRFTERMAGNIKTVETKNEKLVKRWSNSEVREKRRLQWDVHQHLVEWLLKVDIDADPARQLLIERYADDPSTYGFQIMLVDMIADKKPFFTSCDFGCRWHTPVTGISKTLRPLLSIDDQCLVSLDIVSSQPYFLALVVMNALRHSKSEKTYLGNQCDFALDDPNLSKTKESYPVPFQQFSFEDPKSREEENRGTTGETQGAPPYDAKSIPVGPPDGRDQGNISGFSNDQILEATNLPDDVKRFAKDIVGGIFYEKMMETYNTMKTTHKALDRDSAKCKVFGAFYCQIKHGSLMKRVLEEHYPSAMRLLDRLKETDYRRPSRCMQRQESWVMLGIIVKRLLDDHPDIPVVTIHDSILTTREHVETVKQVMNEAFVRLGLVPKLAITDYGA